jgi:hypothetical protein
VEVGDHGSSVPPGGPTPGWSGAVGGEEAMRSPIEVWRKRSASATWRARASAVVRSCSQARAATRMRSSAAAAAVLAFSRAAARALSAAATVEGRGDSP